MSLPKKGLKLKQKRSLLGQRGAPASDLDSWRFMYVLCAGLCTEIEICQRTCKKCAQEIKLENLTVFLFVRVKVNLPDSSSIEEPGCFVFVSFANLLSKNLLHIEIGFDYKTSLIPILKPNCYS